MNTIEIVYAMLIAYNLVRFISFLSSYTDYESVQNVIMNNSPKQIFI